MIDLCHLGDDCAPGIIIEDILKHKKKQLFMLGTYLFNDILSYLKDDNYETIYDRKYLRILPNNHIQHIKYNFILNHDYIISNSQISNYDFVKNRFDVKIKNFKELLLSENMCVFIVFSKNVDNLKIDEMIEWLSLHKKNFHIIIFTPEKHNKISYSDLYSIINMKYHYKDWWKMDITNKTILYKEIYKQFIQCLAYRNIVHDFPLV
jgi:hypothetical protein